MMEDGGDFLERGRSDPSNQAPDMADVQIPLLDAPREMEIDTAVNQPAPEPAFGLAGERAAEKVGIRFGDQKLGWLDGRRRRIQKSWQAGLSLRFREDEDVGMGEMETRKTEPAALTQNAADLAFGRKTCFGSQGQEGGSHRVERGAAGRGRNHGRRRPWVVRRGGSLAADQKN